MRSRVIAVKSAEIGLAVVLFALVTLVSHFTQRPITLNGGLAWDGQSYHAVAEDLAHGRRATAPAPFVYRLGTPAIVAAVFPNELPRGFALVNLAGSFIATMLLVLWLRMHLTDWRIRFVLVSLFLLTWHAPTRLLHYYPVYVDPWLFVALLGGLIAVRRAELDASGGRMLVVGAIAAVGVVFREVALLIPLALVVSRPSRRAFSVLGLAVIVLFGVRLLVDPTGDYSFLKAAASSAYSKAFVGYVHSWFIAYGPLLVVPFVCWREARAFLGAHRGLLVVLAGVVGLSFLGGTDTERMAYWAMPVVYVLVGRIFEAHPRILKPSLGLALFAAAQLVSARAFWTLPDVPSSTPTPLPFMTIPASDFQYLDLYAVHGDKTILVASLAGYLVVSIGIGWWLRHQLCLPHDEAHRDRERGTAAGDRRRSGAAGPL